MKIQGKRFLVEDFDQAQKGWIGKLLAPLNQYTEQLTVAVNQGLTLADNLKAQISEVSVIAGQVYPIKQAYSLNEKPRSVHIGAIRLSDGSLPSSPFSVYWQPGQLQNTLELTFLGLDPTKAYTVTIIAQV